MPDGFFGGPVSSPGPAFAPPSPFGSSGGPTAPPQSQFGSYGQPASPPQSQFGSYGQPASPYVVPPGLATQPKSGRAKPMLAAGGALVVLLGALAGPRVLDQLHRHHTAELPASVGAYNQLDAATETSVSARMQSLLPSKFDGKVTHLKAAVYAQGAVPAVFAVVADVPAGTQRRANEVFRDDSGTDQFHDVAAPASRFGGKVRCTTMGNGTSSMAACGWVDDGTFGLVMVVNGDEPTTLDLLSEVRTASER